MSRRQLVLIGLISSMIVLVSVTLLLSLWRAIPHWAVGQWSLRAQWAITPEQSREALLRSYHHALANGYSQDVNEWLNDKLDPGHSSMEERAIILRFFALRTSCARHPDNLCKRGKSLIGEVLAASTAQPVEDKRGAVMLMVCLRHRSARKLFWGQDSGANHLDESSMVETAWQAYEQWWRSSEIRSEKINSFEKFDDPLVETGISIGSP